MLSRMVSFQCCSRVLFSKAWFTIWCRCHEHHECHKKKNSFSQSSKSQSQSWCMNWAFRLVRPWKCYTHDARVEIGSISASVLCLQLLLAPASYCEPGLTCSMVQQWMQQFQKQHLSYPHVHEIVLSLFRFVEVSSIEETRKQSFSEWCLAARSTYVKLHVE